MHESPNKVMLTWMAHKMMETMIIIENIELKGLNIEVIPVWKWLLDT